MEAKFEKFTIFGTEFKFRLIDFNLSISKNVSINNENFRFFTGFLKRFEQKFTELESNSILTKNVFNINFGSLPENSEIEKIDDNLSIRRLDGNKFMLFFADFKDLAGSLIQFQNGNYETENLTKLEFNYKIMRSVADGKFDRLMLEYNSEDVDTVNLLIV